MKLPQDLLTAPAARGAGHVGLGLVDAAKEAVARLGGEGDDEALHDFRVSLRRLRSILRFYRPELRPGVSKKLIKKLKKVAGATGAGRDAEVQAAYLAEWEPEFGAAHRHGVARLRAVLEARRDAQYDGAVEESSRAFLELEPALRAALAPARAGSRGPTYARATGDLILEAAGDLRDRLCSIRSGDDVKRAHQARIAGKRLRYLIEPLRGRSSAWKRCLSHLKGLQDILGELHDMHVLADEVVRSAEEAAVGEVRRRFSAHLAGGKAPRARDPLPGLLRLARHVRDRERCLYRRLSRNWGEAGRARFFGEIAALAEGLRRLAPPRPKQRPQRQPAVAPE